MPSDEQGDPFRLAGSMFKDWLSALTLLHDRRQPEQAGAAGGTWSVTPSCSVTLSPVRSPAVALISENTTDGGDVTARHR